MARETIGTVNIRQNQMDGGAYAIAAVSAVFTGVAAGTTSAGHLFAMRWPGGNTAGVAPNSPRQFLVLQRLRAKWRTVAGFTAAQQIGMDLSIVRGYSAAHTGGVASMTPSGKRVSGTGPGVPFGTSLVTAANLQISNGGALTNGTETFDAQPIKWDGFAELAAAATTFKGTMEILLSTDDLDRYPVVLAANEGLVIRNTVAMGAAGTAQLAVELDWLEVARY